MIEPFLRILGMLPQLNDEQLAEAAKFLGGTNPEEVLGPLVGGQATGGQPLPELEAPADILPPQADPRAPGVLPANPPPDINAMLNPDFGQVFAPREDEDAEEEEKKAFAQMLGSFKPPEPVEGQTVRPPNVGRVGGGQAQLAQNILAQLYGSRLPTGIPTFRS